MAQIFHRSTNTISRVSLFGAVLLIAGAAWLLARIDRSPYVTREGLVRGQPIPFSHEHHVSGLGIDCRFCHTSVETSAFAGIPPTSTCMQCHREVWTDAPLLEPLRESWRRGEPLAWTRVHDLPDFTYFDHSIHVAKGVACRTCHGPVQEMPLMSKAASLKMEWCLECHRDPAPRVGDPDAVFALAGTDTGGTGATHPDVSPRTSCSTCHR